VAVGQFFYVSSPNDLKKFKSRRNTMKRFLKNRKAISIPELVTATTIVLLIAVLALPSIIRFMNNMRDQALQSALLSLVEAQKSYRDAQTPTTYANSLEELADYVPNLSSLYTFRVVSANADTFRIEGKRTDTSCWEINERGIMSFCTDDVEPGGDDGGGDVGGSSGGTGGGSCFLAGTPIQLPDGTNKAIEEIQAGDLVLAYDELFYQDHKS